MGCSVDFAALVVAMLFGMVAGFPLLLFVFAAQKPRQQKDAPVPEGTAPPSGGAVIIDSTCEVKRWDS